MYLKKNIYLFYAITFFESCIFYVPIWYFFFVNYLNFWVWDAILINTLVWLFSLLFEVHSWWWADRYGRKKVYFLWLVVILFSFSFYLWATELYLFLISSSLMGLWYSLISWNLEALIHDNLEEQERGQEYDKIQSNQYIIMYIWRAFSCLAAWYLFLMWELVPYIATIICYIFVILLVIFIHSPKQAISKEISDYAHIKKALLFLFGKKNLLLVIILAWIIFSWIWNIYWFTYQPYLEKIWMDIKDIGIIYFLSALLSSLWSYIMKKIWVKMDTFSLLKIMLSGLFLSSLMYVYFDNLFWLIPIVIMAVLFWFVMILWNTYLIKVSPKTHKSTILSIYSFAVSLWYFTFCTIAWYVVQFFSLELLYTLLSIIIFSSLILFIFLSRKIKV